MRLTSAKRRTPPCWPQWRLISPSSSSSLVQSTARFNRLLSGRMEAAALVARLKPGCQSYQRALESLLLSTLMPTHKTQLEKLLDMFSSTRRPSVEEEEEGGRIYLEVVTCSRVELSADDNSWSCSNGSSQKESLDSLTTRTEAPSASWTLQMLHLAYLLILQFQLNGKNVSPAAP